MDLKSYFEALIQKVEDSDIQNNGTDENGFFKPTRALLLQRLHMLRDLHGQPRARDRVKDAWSFVVEQVPPEWLVLSADQKKELKKILE